MKIFLLGKLRSITNWMEDVAAGFRAAGHDVRMAAYRNPAYALFIDEMSVSPNFGALRCHYIVRSIRNFRPDIIIAIGGFSVPVPVLEYVNRDRHRPPLVAWVGDAFGENARAVASQFDLVGYTDTGFLELHERFGFTPDPMYLPHAINPHTPTDSVDSRSPDLAFVAVPTPLRRSIVGALRNPISVYGPGWTPVSDVAHRIMARRIPFGEVPKIYARHAGVLNIRSETNVLAGLNQRNFMPCLTGTAVVSDFQPDLERCFTPGEDVLAYRDEHDLNETYERLLREPGLAARIGERGRARVLSEHTYSRRLEAIQNRIN